jgi:hypothetical protein
MINKMYSLLDTKSQTFLKPLSFVNDGDAIRWFTTVVNNTEKNELPALYPEQFILYRIADYDDQFGTFVARDFHKFTETGTEPKPADLQPKEIITGTSVQNPENQKFTQDFITKELRKIVKELKDE